MLHCYMPNCLQKIHTDCNVKNKISNFSYYIFIRRMLAYIELYISIHV